MINSNNLKHFSISVMTGQPGTTNEEIEIIQIYRKKILDLNCKLSKDRKKYIASNEMLDNILVDDKRKLIYCYVPKAGSRTWKTLLVDPYNNRSLTGAPYLADLKR